jgi:L-histidine Nalpha-methyltransferase
VDTLAPADVRIDSYVGGRALDTMAREVRRGFTREPKELPPKYFYDARGSALFDRITGLPEYYPTRCERAILNRHAPQAVEGMEELVELGSGTASKTRALLYAMAGAGTLRRYVPFDVDQSVVQRCADELTELYPGLTVHGVVGDFEHHLEHIPAGDRRLFAFLGGTIGNLYEEERAAFLRGVRALMGPRDRLILGTDLVKEPAVLEAAYDDSDGVTAEFNRNVLRVLNASLGANFDVDAFEHVALYDAEHSRVEMRLRAQGAQNVQVTGARLEVTFSDGEEMRTEISKKFTPGGVAEELRAAGLSLETLLTDRDDYFAVSLARPG